MSSSQQLSKLSQIVQVLEIGEEFFQEPQRLAPPGPWTGHLPAAFWLIKAAKPQILVELGTHSGNSYSAFCQTISLMGLPTRAFAVDTWQGDEHAGFYDESVFQDFNAFNQGHFPSFSKLLRMTFDEARGSFSDGSIDLLHIDGLHTYEAVRHDFENWRSAASDRAVVVFHDTNVRERGFGVWKLWQELSEAYPSFEFHHSEGLGMLGLGQKQSPLMTSLFALGQDPESATLVRRLFSARGETFLSRVEIVDSKLQISLLTTDNAQKATRMAVLEEELSKRGETLLAREHEAGLMGQFIQKKESEIQQKDAYIHEREQVIQIKDELLRERRNATQRLEDLLHGREQTLQSTADLLRQAEQRIAELSREAGSARQDLELARDTIETEISARERLIRDTDLRIQELTAGHVALTKERDVSLRESQKSRADLERVLGSRTWRYTSGLRRLKRRLIPLKQIHPDRPELPTEDRELISTSGFFDAAWYLSQNPDVAAAGVDPVAHYLEFGGVELRDPSPRFSSRRYFEQHADVAAAGVNPLVHYVRFGISEGRLAPPAVEQLSSQDRVGIGEVFSYMAGRIDRAALPRQVFVGASSLGNFFMAEIAHMITGAFRQLGIPATFVNESEACHLPAGVPMVAVAPHEFFHLGDGPKAFDRLKRASRIVMVNTEQPQTQWFALAMNYLKSASAVLDINFEAAMEIHRSGIPAFALPLGYSEYIARTFPGSELPEHPLYEFLPKSVISPLPKTYADRPIDILFIGTASARRHAFFARHAEFFASRNCILYLPDSNRPFLPGDARAIDFATMAALAHRSKIVLNVHRDETPYLEWQRIVTLGILQSTLVITDRCTLNPCITPNLDYLEGPLDGLPTLCNFALHNCDAAESMTAAAFRRLKENYSADQVLGRCWTALVSRIGEKL